MKASFEKLSPKALPNDAGPLPGRHGGFSRAFARFPAEASNPEGFHGRVWHGQETGHSGLLNMLALLAYSLLERQVRQGGLQMTTRRIIEKLQSLDVVETLCRDGSHLLRLVPVDQEQAALLTILAHVLAELRLPHWPHPLLAAGDTQPLLLPPPRRQQIAA